jgi:hypothetical protein
LLRKLFNLGSLFLNVLFSLCNDSSDSPLRRCAGNQRFSRFGRNYAFGLFELFFEFFLLFFSFELFGCGCLDSAFGCFDFAFGFGELSFEFGGFRGFFSELGFGFEGLFLKFLGGTFGTFFGSLDLSGSAI